MYRVEKGALIRMVPFRANLVNMKGEAEQGHEGASEVEKAPEQADADKKATSPLAPQSNHSETKKKKS
ncbi:unnamed protein product [Heligmosomoides polygyrus]|uniref:RPN2_C domain-containing protein n=1 Tax=Heligmosomoides polygyrus TaxID=6339 RepID=A0A183G5D4_HELPZ|nr:unnamed protein product [Heligmosomoides polygyrus]